MLFHFNLAVIPIPVKGQGKDAFCPRSFTNSPCLSVLQRGKNLPRSSGQAICQTNSPTVTGQELTLPARKVPCNIPGGWDVLPVPALPAQKHLRCEGSIRTLPAGEVHGCKICSGQENQHCQAQRALKTTPRLPLTSFPK